MRARKMMKTVCILLCLCLALGTAAGLAAAETAVVRVGYIDYEGFIEKRADGSFFGYGVELLNKISEYTGWRVEYVYDSWQNQLDNLKTGRIDLVCQAQKTPSREEDYLFSDYSTGSETSVLYVAQDDPRYYYDDFDNFDGIRVGFMSGSFQNEEFMRFAQQKDFDYAPVEFESDLAAFDALDAGEMDAVAMGSLSAQQGYKIVCRFGMDPFYLMTGKMNGALMESANDALTEILGQDPYFTNTLYQNYYGASDAAQSLNLTRDEAEYIQSAPVIRTAQLRNRYPLSDYDASSDSMSGINEDVLSRIAEITGLKFESVPLETGETPIGVAESGKYDLIMGGMVNDAYRQNEKIRTTDSYLSSTLAVVTRKGTTFDPSAHYTVAMKSAFKVLQDYIDLNYPQFEVQFYASDEDCMKAVQRGDADILMQNIYVTNYLIQKPMYAELEILPTTFMTEDDWFIAPAATDSRLISILNKAIRMLSQEDMDRIILANTTAKPYQLTTRDVLYKYRVPLCVAAALALLCIVLFVLIILARQRHVNQLSLKNRDLSDAVAQAERANAAKSQFLSRMSHEIRTPMNAIVGLTTIARTCEKDSVKIDDYLTKIASSSRVLLNIINDVLDMSAIENEKLRIAEAEFDLKQVLNGITSIYYPQCKAKDIELIVGADVSDELLIGDSLRVNQILLNLISNAYKFTPSGGTIRLLARQMDKRGEMVFLRFTVSDTGCGMTEDMKNRLFKPFEQETAVTAQRHGGSGLGMSIAKNLVDMMHGAISVESEKGKGTTFMVDLPFKTTGHAGNLTPEKLREIHALVVDDDPNARDYTAIVLGRIGVHYETADSGETAIEMLQKARDAGRAYDICFVDWKMPGVNGVQVTRKIRELFAKNTLIIVVSAYDLSEVEDEAREAGADMFVPKPLFQSTVFNVLMQLSGGAYTKETADEAEYDFTGCRVLLAEDNALNAEIAEELLSLVNMEMDHAEDGRIAVEMFEKSKPGTYLAILMDVQMPNMDGHEAARAIRAGTHPDAKRIPIYAMTANAFTEDVSAALSSGMNGHIAKPIDTGVLYGTLQKCLEQRGQDEC